MIFSLPHRALGGVVLSSMTNGLTIAGCSNATTDGVMIELTHSPAFTAQFQPVSLASNGAVLRVSATATPDYYHYFRQGLYFGPLGVENVSGEKRLQVGVPETNGWQMKVEVFDGTNSAGSFVMSAPGDAGSFGTNDLEVIEAGVVGGTVEQTAALSLRFRTMANLARGDRVLHGDSVRVSALDPENDNGTFVSFQFLARGLAPLTITNEFAAAPPPVRLAIEQAGSEVLISFPAYASRISFLQWSDVLFPQPNWVYAPGEPRTTIQSRSVFAFPFETIGDRFFRLYNPYLSPEPH